jgi:hypothetical protein
VRLSPTSRPAIVAASVAVYLLNWPAMVLGAWIGYLIDRSRGDHGDWDGIVGIVYGGFVALVVVHVAWGVFTWRALRQQVPRRVTAAGVVAVPIAALTVAIVLLRSEVYGWSLVNALAITSVIGPAVATWWASRSFDAATG